MSPTRGGCCGSPPEITCESSIHAHARIARNDVLVPWMAVSGPGSTATFVPSGDRYAGVGCWMEKVRAVAAVQVSTVAFVNVLVSSQTAPEPEGGPAMMHVDPPMVN